LLVVPAVVGVLAALAWVSQPGPWGRAPHRFASWLLLGFATVGALAADIGGRPTAGTPPARLTVFAAASLTDSLKAIAADYEEQAGDRVIFNFAASNTLARQIEEGAPADLFFSADEAKMDSLEGKGLLASGTRTSRLSNRLVIVVAADQGADLRQAAELATDKVKRLALAEPRTVPAGIYAKEYLQRQNLWAAVEQKIVPTENVRAALAAVEAGNVEAGIVYKTDAATSKRVKIAVEVPAFDGPAIRYPMALMKESKHPDAALRFLRYLDSDEAGRIFERFGFIVRPPTATHDR
jgi:molybdate transport system substrate-binding protein